MGFKFRTLKAEEIECRVGQISEDYFTLLLYKDARCDMAILDETVGEDNWQRDHKEAKGNLYCGVAIYDDKKKEWVTKWDCGTESNTEKEKGEASDSFKRACVNWGIGRELYTAPFIKIDGNVKKNSKGKLMPAFWNIVVSEVVYNEKREIVKLSIKGDRKEIYRYELNKTPQNNEKTGGNSNDNKKCEETLTKTEMLEKWGIKNVEETIAWFEGKFGVKYKDWTMEHIDAARAVLETRKIKRDNDLKRYREELKNAGGELPFNDHD